MDVASAIVQWVNNLGCDILALIVAMSRSIAHLGIAYVEIVAWVKGQTDHALVASMLALLALTMIGLYRWRDPLHHDNGSCPHNRICPYYDPAIETDDDEEDEESIVVLPVSPLLTSPPVKPQPKRQLFVEKKKSLMSSYQAWTGGSTIVGSLMLGATVLGVCQVLVALVIISVVGSALYGSWGVYRLGVNRKLCRCRHRAGCYLDAANCSPAPGTEGGEFEIRGNRPGFLDPEGRWVAAGTRNRGEGCRAL